MITTTEIATTSTSIFKTKESRRRILDHYDRLLAEFGFDHNELYIDTSYGSTYVLKCGGQELPALFLLHGSTSNSAAWFADIRELTQFFHVYAVDLIGDAGHSAETRLDMRSDGYARWIREIFEKLEVKKASLMGNSLGAWMCLKFAATFPDMVEKMVLLAASGIAPVRLSFVLRLILFSLNGGKGSEAITQMVYGDDPIPREVKDYLKLIAENYSPYTGEIPVLPDAEMRRIGMPVLYIAGEDDQLTNVPRCTKRIRQLLPGATVYVLPHTGHVIYNVLDRVIPFLKEQA